MSDRPDHARELRRALTEPISVCEKLGLLAGKGTWVRQHGGGVTVRCPFHTEKSPSCSVTRGPDGTIRVRCFGCGVGADVLSLIAAVRGLSTKTNFRDVLLKAAELAGEWTIADEIRGGVARAERPAVAAPRIDELPEVRDYPPHQDIDGVWGLSRPTVGDAQVSAWLVSRGLDPELVDTDDLARALPLSAYTPRWASYHGQPWTATGHRLIVPMVDARGEVRSLRAGRVVDGDSPKRLPPGGHKATGLVMVDAFGRAMLGGTFRPDRVIVVEGEPDFLTWATRPRGTSAVIGIVSGSWTRELVARLPLGCDLIVRTDPDRAGDKYAADAWRLARRQCHIRRAA